MNKTLSITGLALLTLIFAPVSFADHSRHGHHHRQWHSGHTGHAHVVRVGPVIRVIEVRAPARGYRPHEFHRPMRGDPYRGDAPAMIVSGIIGGMIGHQLGDGHGRDAATLLGAAIGAELARGR